MNAPAAVRDTMTREAWRLHRAYMLLLRQDPALADDDLFKAHRAEAYLRFERAMEGL